jgi:hypothetical protein
MIRKATTMTTLPAGLRLFRDQLRDAIQRDIDRGARRRGMFRAARLGAVVLAAAAGLAATIIVPGGAGPRTADAAILRAAAAALTPPHGTILHERATVTLGGQAPQPIEVWAQADNPYAYRVIKFGRESSWDGTRYAVYDPASNTIASIPCPACTTRPTADIAATLRSLIQAGQAHVEGTTVIDGVPAYEIAVGGEAPGWSDGVANGTYDVAQSDYRPLLIESAAACASASCAETVRFQTYEFLPATGANLALLDVGAQHAGARVVPGVPDTVEKTITAR